MKIVKKQIKLREADETVNVDQTPVDKLADIIQDSSEEAAKTLGKKAELSDAQADETAKVAKEVATKVKGDFIMPALDSKNKLTKLLDKCVRGAERDHMRHISDGRRNVLVVGLPGSGKTAIVTNWARKNNVPLFYLDAKDSDVDTAINGYILNDQTKVNAVTRGKSDTLDPLRSQEAVLFLDELNRQTNTKLRGSLLTLINEHEITATDKKDKETGKEKLNKILFTVACINPPEPGAEDAITSLDTAEQSRFTYTIRLDSDVATQMDFVQKNFLRDVENYRKELKDGTLSEEYYKDFFEVAARARELELKILSADAFEFDTPDDLNDLKPYADITKTMLNTRSLHNGIWNSQDDLEESGKDAFLDWIDDTSNYLPRDKQKIKNILVDYEDPQVVFKKDADGVLYGKIVQDGDDEDYLDGDEFDLGDEIDTDMFASGQATASVTSPAAAKQKIQAAFNGLI